MILLLSSHFPWLRASGASSFVAVLFLMLFYLRYHPLDWSPVTRASLRVEGVVILAAKSIPKDVLCVCYAVDPSILMIFETMTTFHPNWVLPAPLG